MQEDIRALALAIGQQTEQLRMLAEMNRKLIEVLTPAQLADEVEWQNRGMEELNGVIVRYIRDMLGMVTKSVLEGTGGLLAAICGLPGRVMTAVRDAL